MLALWRFLVMIGWIIPVLWMWLIRIYAVILLLALYFNWVRACSSAFSVLRTLLHLLTESQSNILHSFIVWLVWWYSLPKDVKNKSITKWSWTDRESQSQSHHQHGPAENPRIYHLGQIDPTQLCLINMWNYHLVWEPFFNLCSYPILKNDN